MIKKETLYTYILPLGLMSVIIFLHFGAVIHNNISLDDSYYYEQVGNVQTFLDIPDVLKKNFSYVDYRPIATLTFAIEKVFSEGAVFNPHISHAINLFIYLMNSWILYLFLLQIPISIRGKHLPLIATLLFATLPLHTSMVANIKSRDGLLSLLFGMTYLYFFLKILTSHQFRLRQLIWMILGILFLLLGIYSKLDAFNFLIATPLLFIFFFGTGKKINFKWIARVAIVVLISYRVFTFLFDIWTKNKIQAIEYTQNEIQSDPILFSENPIVSYSDFSYHLAYGVQTIFEYLKMVFRPHHHYYYYGYDMIPVLPITDPIIWIKFLILLLIGISAIVLLKKNRIYSFGVLFFFICLAYCSNLVTPVSGIVADRYAYTASLGACIALSTLLTMIWDSYLSKILFKSPALSPSTQEIDKKEWIYLLSFIVLLTSIYLPFNRKRSHDWRSLYSIFEADLPEIGTRSYEANRIALRNYIEDGMASNDPAIQKELFTKGFEASKRAIEVYNKGMEAYDGVIYSLYGLERFEDALSFSRLTIAKFDTTEIGWRILTEYYYSNRMLDSAVIGYKALVDMNPGEENLLLFYVTTLQENHQLGTALKYIDSIQQIDTSQYIPYRAKFHVYLAEKDSLKAVENLEIAMSKGWRDNQMLDIAGQYWWTKDQKKWEELKKYLQ
ncbi:MAG: hypothetical protein LC105_08370 [Chitinophagales bacterium]|nr:hypothetical protein [Chitinophagales bacterium]